MERIILFSAGFIFAMLPPAPAQTITPSGDFIVYVNAAASSGNGSSWANATPSLADALKWAKLNKADWQEAGSLRIFVAKGTYKPQYSPEDGVNFGTNQGRDNAFLLVPDVQLFGGFDPVNGILDLDDQRIFGSGGSILSGDLSGNDTEGNLENNRDDNAYHVVVSSGAVGTGLLDGFTIRGGNNLITPVSFVSITVNGLLIYKTEGGGMYNMESSPTLTNVAFTGNKAYYGGGGMVNYSSSPNLINVTIAGNTSIYAGGGMSNRSSSPVLTNVIISGNAVTSQNIGGGIYNISSSPTLTNVTIAGNRASIAGAGMYNSSSSPQIRNSIIWGNTSGINNVSSSTPVISYSLVQELTDTNNDNISSAGIPVEGGTIFTGPSLYTNAPTTTGNYTLASGSPVINEGNNSYFDADETPDLAHITTDLAGNLRIRGESIDLGAYESGEGTLPVILVAFTAILQEKHTRLTWKTTGEFNASHFEIQRSTDARTFKAIGRVEAKGVVNGDTDHGTESYFFNDRLSDSGNLSIVNTRRPAAIYYRLRMVDLDGTFAYSRIESVGVEGIGNTLPARLYPNPVRGDVVVLETGYGMVPPEIKVFDLLGREVASFIRVIAGRAELNVGCLSPGMYLVRVRDQEGPVAVLKFLKE